MDSLAGVRRGGRPTIGCSVRHAGPSNRGKPYPLVSALFGQSVVKLFLLFLAEFLEARIIPKRIEHWIEPEQRRSERHARS